LSGIFIKIQKTIKFSIKNAKCNRTRECLKIFRSQIPSINHFYTFPEIKPTENYLTLIKSLPSEKSLSLAKEYLIKTDIIDKSEVQNQIFLSEERVKERLQLPTEAQYEDFEEEKFDGSNMKHEKELLDQYHQKTEKDDYEGIEDYMEVDKIDKNYEKYKFLLEINGNEEILRYVRGKETVPLWYSESNQWKNQDVRKCEACGGPRVFELQINSTFLNLYKELIEFNWGIIAIYT